MHHFGVLRSWQEIWAPCPPQTSNGSPAFVSDAGSWICQWNRASVFLNHFCHPCFLRQNKLVLDTPLRNPNFVNPLQSAWRPQLPASREWSGELFGSFWLRRENPMLRQPGIPFSHLEPKHLVFSIRPTNWVQHGNNVLVPTYRLMTVW